MNRKQRQSTLTARNCAAGLRHHHAGMALLLACTMLAMANCKSSSSTESGSAGADSFAFAKQVELSPQLAKLRGLSQAQVKQLFPAAGSDPKVGGSPRLLVPCELPGLECSVGFYSDIDRTVGVTLRGDNMLRLVEQAWGRGKPSEMKQIFDQEWTSTETGYHVRAAADSIEFRFVEPFHAGTVGTKPALFGAYQAVRFGLKEADATAKVAAPSPQDSVRWGIARYDDKRGLENITAYLPTGSLAVLSKAWGKPEQQTVEQATNYVWVDSEAGVRATLRQTKAGEPEELELAKFVTYAQVLGGEGAQKVSKYLELSGKSLDIAASTLNEDPVSDRVSAFFGESQFGAGVSVECNNFTSLFDCSVEFYHLKTYDPPPT